MEGLGLVLVGSLFPLWVKVVCFPFWKGRSEFWISLCAILVYTEDDILVFGEVCDEVLDQEVFECLSSGVQDIAWIDLKHI